ncbi:tail assembly protein [Microcystis phage vB_MweS-yong2]|nr:tail assembly protein [Microcystis phage vB_MweS-yong2]
MTAGARLEQLPDGSARIHFAAPILHHDEPRRFVTLRPPTAGEALEHGDPATWIVQGDGESQRAVSVVDRQAALQWFRLLCVDHDADMVLRSSDISIGLLAEDAVLGFFSSARRRLRTASAQPSAPASP